MAIEAASGFAAACLIEAREGRPARLIDAVGALRLRLEHREHDDPVFKFARSKPRSRDPLELRPIFVKIAEGLLVGLKRRCKSAYLSRRADREGEGNRSASVGLCSGHDQHSPARDSVLDNPSTALTPAIAATSLSVSLGPVTAGSVQVPRRRLPWPRATRAVAPCSFGPRSPAVRHPRSPARLLRRPAADDRRVPSLQATVLPISWRSSFTPFRNRRNPLNPGDRAGSIAVPVHP